MKRSCELCNATLSSTRNRTVPSCTSKHTSVMGQGRCWLKSSSNIQIMCAQSVGELKIKGERRRRVISLFAKLGDSAIQGDPGLDAFLAGLFADERQELLHFSANELRRVIAIKIDKMDLDANKPLKEVDIPDGLPAELDSLLRDYREFLIRRFRILIDKNHRRSSDYVARSMFNPIRFCVYLGSKDIVTWGQVGNTELAAFLEYTNSKLSSCLKRFIKYAQEKRSPFKKSTSHRPRRGGGVLVETPRPQIIHPDELKSFLSDLRNSLDDTRYLWAWLVCKLGLTVKRASELTLADIRINEQNRCVIRPSEVWVLLPKSIERIVLGLADKLYPVWRSGPQTVLTKLRLLSSASETPRSFSRQHLQNKALIIRASAIYAMMENGHLDRVTLKKTIGVSMPTLAKLERLFSVDVHRRLDPEFIKLRNAHITGQVKHE